MIPLLQSDLVLLLIAPIALTAIRLGPAAALLGLPLAGLQFLPSAEAAIGQPGLLAQWNALARAACLVGLPWLAAWSTRREHRESAVVGRRVWTGMRAVQLGEFLSFALYQLREYLISVTSLVEALSLSVPKENAALAEKIARLKRIVGELNAKASRLLGDSSAITTQAREPKPFDVGVLVRRAAEEARAAFAEGPASISVTAEGELPLVPADARSLRACVLAVLQNGLEAAGSRPARLSVLLRKAEDAFQIEIADESGGIAPAALSQIFEPLFSARSSTQGLGLGLPMSRRLMERMGGALRIKSRDGCTAVLLELPLQQGLPVIRNEESTWAGRRSRI